MPAALSFLIVFIVLAIEARRASANESRQRARGGLEPSGDVYGVMRVAYPGAFALMVAEEAVRGAPPLAVVAVGASVFAAAKALKWWAIETLGPCWTFRVIVVPEMERVATGPYRYVRHPNYLAVVGELVGVALATGAWISGPIATVAFVVLILKRIRVEERALDAILRRTAEHPSGGPGRT